MGVTSWQIRIHIFRRNYVAQYGTYFWGTDQDGHFFHLNNTSSRGLSSYGATYSTASTALLVASTLGAISLDLQYMKRPGLQVRAGHLGGTDQRLQPNGSERDQDHRPGLLPQQFGIQRGMFSGDHDGGWLRQGGSRTIIPGPIPGLEHIVYALPRAKRVDLQGCRQRQTYPAHWDIHPSLQPGALT